jgi:hypothetical protein
MKALIFLLMSTAALAAQDQPPPSAPEPPKLSAARSSSQPWQHEHWDQVFDNSPIADTVSPLFDRARKRAQWLKWSRAGQQCFQMPNGSWRCQWVDDRGPCDRDPTHPSCR